ncbi:hypothetical protein, conserved [Eimeria tenella]|uniref:Uncharacterized protein n=1 Tax=Eimeria tenella TaxID=5802 RepID=U6L562_EIMTE|nr:hypothetical protein, conserved [Eimeria tenella]CDJ45306.1 hypothetical protein, conserved [Eimeria tenella]|eukprot:XP_013236052.1 hypothetical protein, conserved [Eimeria tenella]
MEFCPATEGPPVGPPSPVGGPSPVRAPSPVGGPAGGPRRGGPPSRGALVAMKPLREFPGVSANFDGLWQIWLRQQEALSIEDVPPLGAGGPSSTLPEGAPPARQSGGAPSGAPPGGPQKEAPGGPQEGPPETYRVMLNASNAEDELVYDVYKEQPLPDPVAAAAAAAAATAAPPPSVYPSEDPLGPPATWGAPGPPPVDPFASAVGASEGFNTFWERMQRNRAQQYY